MTINELINMSLRSNNIAESKAPVSQLINNWISEEIVDNVQERELVGRSSLFGDDSNGYLVVS